MGDNKMTNAQRAKLQKERKKMVREAKNYQKERRQAENAKRSSSNNRPAYYEEERRGQRANTAKRPPKTVQNKPVKMRKNDYGDEFFVDETKKRKEAYNKKQQAKRQRQKPPLTPKQRRRRHVITYCLIFTVVVAIGLILSLTVLFKTEKINIEGNTLYEEDKIMLLSGVQMEQNIFIAKFSSTPEKISGSLPYIEEAWVDFKIPDTITISVKNATPAYAFVSNNKYYIVSNKGKILSATEQNTENLTMVLGVQVTDEQIGKHIEFEDENTKALLNEISQCCIENDFKEISYVDITDTSEIFIVYDNRIKIVIGLPEDVTYKIKTAMTIITEKLDMEGSVKASGTLDVSECNTTKKSYFKDGVIPTDSNLPTMATQPPTEATEPSSASEDSEDSENSEDSEDNSSSDDYSWTPSDEGDYSDENSDNNYSDESNDDQSDWNSGDEGNEENGDGA